MLMILQNLGITLHPDKSYIQHYNKGVTFLETQIKPHRLMIGCRLRSHSLFKISRLIRKESDFNQIEKQ